MKRILIGTAAILLCVVGVPAIQLLMPTTALDDPLRPRADADETATLDLAIQSSDSSDVESDAGGSSEEAVAESTEQQTPVASDSTDPTNSTTTDEAVPPRGSFGQSRTSAATPQTFERSLGGGGLAGGLRGHGRARGFGSLRGAGQPDAPINPGSGGVWSKSIGITWSEDRDTLYGFSATTGTWSALAIPPQDEIVPMVGLSMAAVPLGNRIAAFSGSVCRWDVLKLDQPPETPPDFHTRHILQRTDDHLYTFAEGLGKWTSPTDQSLQAGEDDPETSAPSGRVLSTIEDEAKVSAIDAEAIPLGRTGMLPFGMRNLSAADVENAESKSIEIAMKLRSELGVLPSDHPKRKQLVSDLREAVTQAYTARQELQKKRMKSLEERLSRIRESLNAREELQERIIERRVEELLDPDVDWQAVRSRADAEPGRIVGLTSPPHLPPQPASGRKVSEPTSSAEPVEVPDLIGMRQKHAVMLLHELGLTNSRIDITRDPDDRQTESHRVLAQSPDPGTLLDTESRVSISLGSQKKTDSTATQIIVEASVDDRVFEEAPVKDREVMSATGRATFVPSSVDTSRPFDWDELERMRLRLHGGATVVSEEKAAIDNLMQAAAVASVAWADATQDERRHLVRLLRERQMSRSFAFKINASDADEEEERINTIVEDQDQYEQLRATWLEYFREQLERRLKRFQTGITDLERSWRRYQGTLEDHRLNLKQAELELRHTKERLQTINEAFKARAVSQSQVAESRLEHDRAVINFNRTRQHVQRLQRLSDDNPQFDPGQYRTFLEETQEQLEDLQSGATESEDGPADDSPERR